MGLLGLWKSLPDSHVSRFRVEQNPGVPGKQSLHHPVDTKHDLCDNSPREVVHMNKIAKRNAHTRALPLMSLVWCKWNLFGIGLGLVGGVAISGRSFCLFIKRNPHPLIIERDPLSNICNDLSRHIASANLLE